MAFIYSTRLQTCPDVHCPIQQINFDQLLVLEPEGNKKSNRTRSGKGCAMNGVCRMRNSSNPYRKRSHWDGSWIWGLMKEHEFFCCSGGLGIIEIT